MHRLGGDYEWMKGRFGSKEMGEARHDGVPLDRRRARENQFIDQDRNLRAIVYWGHAPTARRAAPT